MSHKLGITDAYLGYLERGQRNPSLLTLAKIAAILDVSPYMLLREPKGEFDEAVYGLNDMLIGLNEVKHVAFLQEVMEAYLKLRDT
ncbi:MAG: helix-turn-helix protein [Pelotomaculum sp. PtaU1.Bin035]|nr:MAG: helix-turn-helix protein [Pelotomaculum sp. PtaU1.Bin035]